MHKSHALLTIGFGFTYVGLEYWGEYGVRALLVVSGLSLTGGGNASASGYSRGIRGSVYRGFVGYSLLLGREVCQTARSLTRT